MRSLPSRVDRYPGKMVAHLAEELIERYARDADHLLDPFCGSGAIISAGCRRGMRVTGIDINPFGILLSRVKVEGFDAGQAVEVYGELVWRSQQGDRLPVRWTNKDYWFTPATLRKYEELRCAAAEMKLNDSEAGRAVLLALGLSVRRCSRADQRSPKPFISQKARVSRRGKHFDPRRVIKEVLVEMIGYFGDRPSGTSAVFHCDVVDPERACDRHTISCSHVITSPPYVNAQDYFRNSKLELYVLEGLIPFRVEDVMRQFVGTERGLSRSLLDDSGSEWRRQNVPELRVLEEKNVQKAKIVHRYISDMRSAFLSIRRMLRPDGKLVLVCGDNLVGGVRIVTWRALRVILQSMGFVYDGGFEDRIRNRALPPRRKGHMGLIKQEVVAVYNVREYS